MNRRNPFPAKKSRLPPLGKALAAVHVVKRALDERMDNAQIQAYLKQEVGLNWNLLTAFQYLTGKEAMGALGALPNDWVGEDGTDKLEIADIVSIAHHMCANFAPSGAPLSAGDFVKLFRNLPPGP